MYEASGKLNQDVFPLNDLAGGTGFSLCGAQFQWKRRPFSLNRVAVF